MRTKKMLLMVVSFFLSFAGVTSQAKESGTKNQANLPGKNAAKSPAMSDQDKASYGIGQQIGKGLKSQGIDINIDVLGKSIEDVLKDRPSRLTAEEIQKALEKVQKDVQKRMAETAKKNKEDGEKYLKENEAAKGVKKTEKGVQYVVVKEGKGSSPSGNDEVKVKYKGTLLDGTVFDSTESREPAVFPLTGVIEGWTDALKEMKPGAVWDLTIPSHLAYGSRGRPSIPPNSVLKFTVELVEVLKDEVKK